MTKKKKGMKITVDGSTLTSALLVVLFMVVLFNQFTLMKIRSGVSGYSVATGDSQDDIVLKLAEEIIPKEGTATNYDVPIAVDSIGTLVGYYEAIQLDQIQARRYVRIGTAKGTACEACCPIGDGGALRSDGNLACGCEHNIAIAGLIKHLVVNYPEEYDDQAIYDEIQLWKKFFFPKYAVEKEMASRGLTLRETELATQVGGC